MKTLDRYRISGILLCFSTALMIVANIYSNRSVWAYVAPLINIIAGILFLSLPKQNK